MISHQPLELLAGILAAAIRVVQQSIGLALAIEGPDGSPVVLNRPCGPPPGLERRVANHLGVFARRLADRKGAGR